MTTYDKTREILITFVLSGTLSMTTKTIFAPLERTKLILQNQSSAYQVLTGETKPYNGIGDVLRRLPKEQGYLSFWRGNGVNLIRTFPTMAFNFAFNDIFNTLLIQVIDPVKHLALLKLLSGGMAGLATGTLLYPLEFCQTKLASDFGSDPYVKTRVVKREYSGLTNCIKTVWHREGYAGYFKGWHVQAQGLFWYRGLYFGLYDLTKKGYLKHQSIRGNDSKKISLLPNFLMASATTIISGLSAYPFDTVGRKLMLDSARPADLKVYKNARDAFSKLYKQNGIKTFYKGAMVNSIRATSSASVLVLYDQILARTGWIKKKSV